MSTNNEKLIILKMLEEGKISAAEAARLIDEIKKGSGSAPGRVPYSPSPTYSSSTTYSSSSTAYSSTTPTVREIYGESSQSHNNPRPGTGYGETFADEMSRKLNTFVKDMEPKLQKITEAVVQKTATAADSISKSLSAVEKAIPTTYKSSPPPHPTSSARSQPDGRGIEQAVDFKITGRGGDLNFSGLNGQIFVKGYNGDKISAKIYWVPKKTGAKVELMNLGSKYYLSYDENEVERVCVDAFVPEMMFDNILLSTINGAISVQSLNAQNVKIENMNGVTNISGLSVENIIVSSNNGRLTIKELSAKQAAIDNFNGDIDVMAVDAMRLKVTTFNGKLDVKVPSLSKYSDYEWTLESGNSPLNLVLPSSVGLGFHIKAHAALSNVKLGIVGLNYLCNDRSMVEAKSINYDSVPTKLKLNIETSNAPLNVN